MDAGFSQAQSDNLPAINATMMAVYFKSCPEFMNAAIKGVKAESNKFCTMTTEKKDFFDAESYENNAGIEEAWLNRTVEHMEVHFNLITSVDPAKLKLTPHDDEIYKTFQEEFPEFKLDVIEEDSLKSKENKEKWNKFCNFWKDKIDDALFGTLVRLDSKGSYSPENTIFVVRIQFLAIEIARNRLGFNNVVYESKKKVI